MNRFLCCLAIGCMCCTITCGDGSDVMVDPIWFASYTVENATSMNLFFEPWGYDACSEDVFLGPGEAAVLIEDNYMLGPEPEAEWYFSCISVRRQADSALVYQMSPVSNVGWVDLSGERRVSDFVLRVTHTDLGPTFNACPRLHGVVKDANTHEPIRGVCAYLRYKEALGDVAMTNPMGTYRLLVSSELPPGTLRFTKAGYDTVTYVFPDVVADLGEHMYRFDVELVPSN